MGVLKTTDVIRLLREDFYLSIYDDSKKYAILEKYIKDDDGIYFAMDEFVENELDTFGLIPEEMNKKEVGCIYQKYRKTETKETGGYIQIFIKRFIDTKFQNAFNISTDSYYKNQLEKDFDLSEEFFEKLEKTYDIEKEMEVLDFSAVTTRKRNLKNNFYEIYRVYAQGEYSKLFIGYQNDLDHKIQFNELRAFGFKSILADENKVLIGENISSIQESLADFNKKELKDKETTAYEKQIEKIEYLLQKKNSNFKPYKLEDKIKNTSLREEIVKSNLAILKTENSMARKLGSNYEDIKYSYSTYTTSQKSTIKRHFEKAYKLALESNDLEVQRKVKELEKKNGLKTKVEFLLSSSISEIYNADEHTRGNAWSEIVEKFKGVQSGEDLEGVEDKKEEINLNDIEEKVICIFEDKFENASAFINSIIKLSRQFVGVETIDVASSGRKDLLLRCLSQIFGIKDVEERIKTDTVNWNSSLGLKENQKEYFPLAYALEILRGIDTHKFWEVSYRSVYAVYMKYHKDYKIELSEYKTIMNESRKLFIEMVRKNG